MMKVTTTQFFEDSAGKSYEVRKIRRVNQDGESISSTQIIKRPEFNRDIDVEDSTKSIIDNIKNGASNE
jgi:hypothetical protein